MSKKRSFFKNLMKQIKEEDAESAASKLSRAINSKLSEMEEEQKESFVGDVIVKDEEDVIIDVCQAEKPQLKFNILRIAENSVAKIVEQEEIWSKRINNFLLAFHIIYTLVYTVLTVSYVFARWNESLNPVAVTIALAVYITLFVVVTVINIVAGRSSSSAVTKRKIAQNYKSIAKILRRLMLLTSLVLTIFVTSATWDYGIGIRIANIATLILISIILMAMVLREVTKIKKRLVPKKATKFHIFKENLKVDLKNATFFRAFSKEHRHQKKDDQPANKKDFTKKNQNGKD